MIYQQDQIMLYLAATLGSAAAALAPPAELTAEAALVAAAAALATLLLLLPLPALLKAILPDLALAAPPFAAVSDSLGVGLLLLLLLSTELGPFLSLFADSAVAAAEDEGGEEDEEFGDIDEFLITWFWSRGLEQEEESLPGKR